MTFEPDPDGEYGTCTQCRRDCLPEPFEADEGLRVTFVCAERGVHSVIDPFEGER
ncbi:hypothetical protein [Cryobacterium shii]|uniref:hypothetical protein n=1 Tax=Cryobacterium shii TaxID=1259235 RepID=UPI001357E134|nr:hypothetical protein [Cryobacterium shii]